MASLFEIKRDILACVKDGDSIVNTDTGEIIDVDALNALKMEAREKEENIAMWIRNLDSEASQLKEQKDIFAQREKSCKAKSESLKQYLTLCLQGKKFETPRVKVSFRKSKAVEIKDETKIPKEFLVYKDPTVDKTGIKKAIADGKEVPGAELIERANIQVK